MKVKNHLLYDNTGKQVEFKQTPNHGGNKKSTRFVVIHYDASPNATSALNWMLSPKSQVSAELWIGRDGKVVQLLPFNLTAYHAGKSEWRGVVGLNSHAIGIELQNSGTQEYTQTQLDKLVEVCKALDEAYPIEEFVGHSDISPGRKSDPGKQFPWAWFLVELKETKLLKTTADLNLRAGSGTTHKVITVLPKGTEVQLLQEEPNGWVKIQVPTNKLTGYVNKSYLK